MFPSILGGARQYFWTLCITESSLCIKKIYQRAESVLTKYHVISTAKSGSSTPGVKIEKRTLFSLPESTAQFEQLVEH